MTRYLVFEPPAALGEEPEGATGAAPGMSDRAVFVRDGFARWALFFPFLWLFRHRLWLAGILTLAVSVGLAIVAERPGMAIVAAVLPLLMGVLVGLEGPSLRAARYRRKGFREAAVIDARNEDEAAILYYAGAETDEPEPQRPAPVRPWPAFVGRARRGLRPVSLLDAMGRR